MSIAYTGVAVANLKWMDSVIASCLAHRQLDDAMIQTGAHGLARPVYRVIDELCLNLNGRLNSDPRARNLDLRLSVVGWHLGVKIRPFSWELYRGAPAQNGMRYFQVTRNAVGKFLREHPTGLSLETLGDADQALNDRLAALGQTDGFTHDDVERYIVDAIAARAAMTPTVGPSCLAIQLDPRDPSGHAQITYYPDSTEEAPTFLTGWLLTPRMICSPGNESTFGSSPSTCGLYVVGGFSDGFTNLHVRTRLPAGAAHYGGPTVMAYGTQRRAAPR